MPNLTNELASRGSKLCMQIAVNNLEDDYKRDNITISRKSRKHLLDDLIGLGEIKWLFPLTADGYKEYQLNDISKLFPDETALENMDWSFWPSERQPQWDAVGYAPDSTLILIEAKAHTSEIEGSGTKAREKSKRIIHNEIISVMGDDEAWINKYYQTANRILFLKKIKDHYGNNRNVLLVFLNFVNDVTYIPQDLSEWEEYINKMKSDYIFPKLLEPYIKYVYMDIWGDKGV